MTFAELTRAYARKQRRAVYTERQNILHVIEFIRESLLNYENVVLPGFGEIRISKDNRLCISPRGEMREELIKRRREAKDEVF